ncbi:MAG: ChaN family lipoprotein [Planctomycetota bacterium]
MAIRTELIKIQKRLVKRYRDEIRRSIADYSPIMSHYRADYHREVSSYKRTATQRELIDKVLSADIVYCGDYHTLFVAQRSPIKILSEIAGKKDKIILVLEMVHAHHQHVIDKFMADKIDEETFLKRIDYEHAWGFIWNHYKIFFEFAKENNIKVVGMNSEPHGVTNRLRARDEFAAKIIVREAGENPGALIFVVDGDWHVAPSHLPAKVENILKKQGVTKKRLIIFQNSERIYWQLCKKRLEHRIDVVQIHKDTYCIITAVPLVKLQSYLNWEYSIEELGYSSVWEINFCGQDYTEQLSLIIKTIAGYLNIKEHGLDDFTLYSTADLNFLDVVKERGKLTEKDIRQIKKQIEQGESYFIPEGRIIYLSNLSINHAAEEASHFINIICAGKPPKKENVFDSFYRRIIAEALGFLGSKIINHKRHCHSIKDFEYFIKESKRRKLPSELAHLKNVSKYVLQHKKFEKGFATSGKYTRLPNSIYEADNTVYSDTAHALGYIFGNQLYQAMINEAVPCETIKELFYNNFSKPQSAFAAYMSLCCKVAEICKLHTEESDEW